MNPMILNLNFTQKQIRGIEAAREVYNGSIPEGSELFKNTNEEYITFVLLSASDSYANIYNVESYALE